MDTSTFAWAPLPAEPAALQRWREEARTLIARLGLPQATDEHWRRADFGFLRTLEAAARGAVPTTDTAALPAEPALAGFTHLRFVDGRFDGAHSTPADDIALTVTRLSAALRAAPPARPCLPNDALQGDLRPALLNHALGADGVNIVVHRDGTPARPIVIDHRGAAAQQGLSVLSHAIRLEANASATLVELYDERPTASRALLGELRIELAPGSRLTHLRLAAATHAPAHHVDTLIVEIDRDAHYEQRALWAPQHALRSTQSLRLIGRGAQATLNGGAIVRSTGANVDLRLLAEHEADATGSAQTLHVLGAGGRATVDSEARVPRGRRAIRSRQSLRGVLLGERCDIALRPRLAILSDDVDCRHGATTAALAPDALFFLRSRGLALAEAQRLLAAAHLQQLLPPTGDTALDALVSDWLHAALHAAVAAPTEAAA
jgi:Fe-S cluster assembly protein SufD